MGRECLHWTGWSKGTSLGGSVCLEKDRESQEMKVERNRRSEFGRPLEESWLLFSVRWELISLVLSIREAYFVLLFFNWMFLMNLVGVPHKKKFKNSSQVP